MRFPGPRPTGGLGKSPAASLRRSLAPLNLGGWTRAGSGGGGHWSRLASTLGCGCGVAALSMRSPMRGKGQAVRSSANTGSWSTFGSPERKVTDTLLVGNVVMFGLQMLTGYKLLAWGAKVNAAIVQGEWWRLFTAAFLHADIMHLGFNCMALHQIGPIVEVACGSTRFGVIYMGSAFAGNLLSFMRSPHMSVGASGAIFGIAAALAVFAYRHRELMGQHADYLLRRLGDTAAINFMYGLIIRRIDNWGHIGGMLGGAVLTYLLGPKLILMQSRQDNRVRLVDRPPLPILAHRPSPKM